MSKMATTNVFLFQVFIPFVLFLIGEWIGCSYHLKISTSIKTFGWIFSITVGLYIHRKIISYKIQTCTYTTFAIFAIYTSYLTTSTDDYKTSLNSYVNIFVCILWTQVWNFFDNSWLKFSIYFKRKWISVFVMFYLWCMCFIGLFIVGCIILIIFKAHSIAILQSKHTYVTFNKAEFIRQNLNVELKQANPGDSIRIDTDYNQSLYKNDKRFPICKRLFRRYFGEDVKMECSWPIEFVKILNYETKWTHNGKQIAHSIRKKTTSLSGNNRSDTLSIFIISKSDYGKYQLWVSGQSKKNYIQKYRKINYMIAFMVLTPIYKMISYVYVPVGNGLVLDYQVDYSFETNVTGWEYKIENSLTGTSAFREKYDRLFDGCSLLSYLLMQLLIAMVGRNDTINKPTISQMTNKEINVIAILCTTEVLYGKHYIQMSREFYNETSNTKQNVTTALNFVYIVLPAESINIYNMNYDKYNTTLKVEDIESSDILYESRIWLIRQIIEVILFSLSAYHILKLCKYYTNQFDRQWVSTALLKSCGVKYSSCNSLGYISKENEWHIYEYDVLLISTENDNDFAKSIITCLEDKGYKVCVPDRDFKAGMSMFSLFSKAVQTSYTIVVICSEDFLKDSFLNGIVFGDFIMSMSIDGKINDKNILLVIKDNCYIPNAFKKKYEFLDTLGTFPLSRSNKRQLYNWIESRILLIRYKTIFVVFRFIILCLNHFSLLLLANIIVLHFFEKYSELTLLSSEFMSNAFYFVLFSIFCSQLAVMKYGRRIKL